MSFSEHFTARDFGCHDGCGFGTKSGDVSDELVQLLEAARLALGRPIVVTSGCRCAAQNKASDGVAHSAHVRGTAADMRAVDARARWELVVAMVVGALWRAGLLRVQPWLALSRLRTLVRGLGVGPKFVHVDVDQELADEDKRPAVWGYGADQP